MEKVWENSFSGEKREKIVLILKNPYYHSLFKPQTFFPFSLFLHHTFSNKVYVKMVYITKGFKLYMLNIP